MSTEELQECPLCGDTDNQCGVIQNVDEIHCLCCGHVYYQDKDDYED